MTGVVDSALEIWGMSGADCCLVAERENRVFRVEHLGRTYALRLHRTGYRSDAELWSELQWMEALTQGGLQVPTPIASRSGEFLHVINGVQIDVLTWLSGVPLGRTGQALEIPDRTAVFRTLGQEMAKLHAISDLWTPPESFTRCCWDSAGLLGDRPVWGRFWENPTLSNEQRAFFQELRCVMQADLAALEGRLDFGLVHADLVRENVLVHGDALRFIDFDDAGFGFRLFDMATTLLRNMDEPDFEDLKNALFDGYLSTRSIDLEGFELFLLLRATTYVGWIVPRMSEAGSQERNKRFVLTALSLAVNYMDRKGQNP